MPPAMLSGGMAAQERILFLLKTRGPATAPDLAARLGVSAQAVREQLAALAQHRRRRRRRERTGWPAAAGPSATGT